MLKVLRKFSYFGLVFFVFLFLVPTIAQAAGVNVSYLGHPGPLFQESNLAPGAVIEKVVNVSNEESIPQELGFKLMAGPHEDLKEHITLTVKRETILLAGPKKLAEFYGLTNETSLGSLSPGQTANYIFIAKLDPTLGNEYQNRTETFALTIGFSATETPSENPSVPESPLTPFITFLTSPFLGENTEATGEVAGATATDPSYNEENQSVKGDDIQGSATCPWWWIVLLGLFFILSIVYINYSIRVEPRMLWAWPLGLGATAWIVHWWFHRYYKSSPWCARLWWLELIVIIILTSLYLLAKKRHEKDA